MKVPSGLQQKLGSFGIKPGGPSGTAIMLMVLFELQEGKTGGVSQPWGVGWSFMLNLKQNRPQGATANSEDR